MGSDQIQRESVPIEVGDVSRVCPPSCRRNKLREECACAVKAKIVTRVEIFALFGGVRRYRAHFTPDKKNSGGPPRISNKDLLDEQGQEVVETGVFIPKHIFLAMLRRASAIIKSGALSLP